jgi:hypothetical protein
MASAEAWPSASAAQDLLVRVALRKSRCIAGIGLGGPTCPILWIAEITKEKFHTVNCSRAYYTHWSLQQLLVQGLLLSRCALHGALARTRASKKGLQTLQINKEQTQVFARSTKEFSPSPSDGLRNGRSDPVCGAELHTTGPCYPRKRANAPVPDGRFCISLRL